MRNLAGVGLILLTTSLLARGQNESGTDGVNFQGQVRYENNAPAQFTRVELWTDGETTWRAIINTDQAGRFHTGAPCMVVHYKVDVPGFRPVLDQVDMSIKPCKALEDITLRRAAETQVSDSRIPGSSATTVNVRIAAIPPDARKEFNLGYKAVKDDDYVAAIPQLQKAIGLYPRYAEAYQLLAVAQLQTNHPREAESSLTKAIEIDARIPQTQYLLGVLYAKTGRASLAEGPLTRFAELDPQNPDAHFELAKVRFALNKFAEAETQARKSIELKESDSGVVVVLGYALLRQKKPGPAKEAFQQFLKRDPNGVMAADVRNLIAEIEAQVRAAPGPPVQ